MQSIHPPFLLFAEDDDDDAFILGRIVAKLGIVRVERCRDGASVIHFLESGGPLPCLVVLDLRMPLMNGLDVLAWIKSHRKLADLPVVMLSGAALPKEVEMAKRLGADEYFLKPPTTAALGRYVATHCPGLVQSAPSR